MSRVPHQRSLDNPYQTRKKVDQTLAEGLPQTVLCNLGIHVVSVNQLEQDIFSYSQGISVLDKAVALPQ